MITSSEQISLPRASLWRRLGAILYDSLLVFAVLMAAAAIPTLFTTGEAINPNPLMTSYLFLVLFLFFAGFWIHGGQTLGMRAWRLRIQTKEGRPIGWWHALLRFLTALPAWCLFCVGILSTFTPIAALLPTQLTWLWQLPKWLLLGLASLWILFDNLPHSWRDRFSETHIVVMPKS